MIKVCALLALTFVAGVAGLQEGAPPGEAAPEPYAYAYQTDTHAASEQRDPQGRVTGYYTLADADGRERRVEYVADEGGFRAKVATNEVGTKSENPANVEVLAAEPTPAQYAAYNYQGAAAPAAVQTAQYARQQTTAVPAAANYGRAGYFQQQQYAYRPAGYYNGYATASPYGYGTNYNGAYGGYGAGYGASYGANYGANYGYGPSSYSYGAGPASQYYSYRSSATAPASSGYAGGYAAGYAPATYGYVTGGAVPTQYYSYRASAAGAPATVGGYAANYRSVAVPAAGVSSYSAGFPGATAARSSGYQGSSNYLVIQKRAAEKEEAEKKAKSS